MRDAVTAFASVLIAWAAIGAAPGFAQQAELDSGAITPRVDSVFAEYDRTDSPGCALGVIRDGELIYARGYGMANLDLGVAITPASVFRIGSTSKQFTAAAVVLAAQNGELSLEDDIRKHLPEMPDYGRTITIRDLLHHTSGIRDYIGLMYLSGLREDDWFTDGEVVAMVARQQATNFEPGSEHLYSNSGYFLISQIVKRATGMSLREYAQEHIFRPLGMTHTHFHDDHKEIVAERASGYAPARGGGFRISMTTLDMVGDGGVFTTVEDLLLWDGNFYEPRVGGDELVQTMLQRGVLTGGDTLSYALGLGHAMYRGLPTVRHGGAWVGFRAQMIRFPEQRFSVICLCNLAAANPTELAEQVADVYLADLLEPEQAGPATAATSPDDPPIELARDELARWVGLYRRLDGDSYLQLEMREDKLTLAADAGYELVPLAEDRFRLAGIPVQIHFAVTEDGSRMTVVQRGGRRAYDLVEAAKYSAAELAAFAGTFHSEELDSSYRIYIAEGELKVLRGRGDPETLRPTVADEFMLAGARVTFERDVRGRAGSFVLNAGRVRGIRFVRIDGE
jgi:CubicO group peptidase (beta-lactamase class C family)